MPNPEPAEGMPNPEPATDKMFGFMFQAGYDSRKGSFNQIVTPCLLKTKKV